MSKLLEAVESVEYLLKKNKLVAIAKCCKVPMNYLNFKNKCCPMCLSTLEMSKIGFQTKESYNNYLTKESN